MQRYSLYIDHQLVSGMIRQLENIVRICSEELDGEYQTYELRTSIYEQFVFQVAATFNAKYAFKQEEEGLKDEQLKKFYQLTAKLEGINSSAKFEDINLHSGKVKKGRPSKHQEAEQELAQWINQKVKNQGKLKFLKKQLDDIYLPLINEEKKKVTPVNFYLKILKRYQLIDVSIVARGGKQRTVKDFIESKNLSNSFWKKEEEDQSTLKYEFVSGQLQSTSEIQSQLQSDLENSKEAHMITKASRFDDNQGINSQKRKLRSSKGSQLKKDLKSRKQRQKRKTFNNILDDNSDQEEDYNHWNKNLSMSNDLMEEVVPNAEIYENSKSFE